MTREDIGMDLPRIFLPQYEDLVVYSFCCAAFVFSFFVHLPCPSCPGEYSDLSGLFFQVFSNGSRWFGGVVQAVGIPYVDYRFEYPPLVAGIFYVTSVISLVLSRFSMVPRPIVFYNVLALVFVLPTYLLYIKSVLDVSKLLGSTVSRTIFAVAGFGIAYYVVFNFDIIAIAFAILSLFFLIQRSLHS
jgi:hypothetical protein